MDHTVLPANYTTPAFPSLGIQQTVPPLIKVEDIH